MSSKLISSGDFFTFRAHWDPPKSSPDCNRNGIPDECDIADGSSKDLDGNGIPDECDRPVFHRGDPNGGGETDLSDAIYIFGFLFLGGKPHALVPQVDAKGCVRIAGCTDLCGD